MIDAATLAALAAFPERLSIQYVSIPVAGRRWMPPSWSGMVGERFNVSEQVSHLADIETAYHHRFQRLLTEDCPELVSLDGERLAFERSYATANCEKALEAFGTSRAGTMEILTRLSEVELARRGTLEDFGGVTIDGLAHHLCAHDHLHLAAIQWLRGQMTSTGHGDLRADSRAAPRCRTVS